MPHRDKASILIVDDLPDKLLVLETVLSDLGEDIVTARINMQLFLFGLPYGPEDLREDTAPVLISPCHGQSRR